MWASTRSSALRLAAAVALGAMIAASPARGADASKAPPLPAPVAELAPDARIQGAGAFRFLGMSIYDGFYWSAVRDALAPGARACIQAITIAEDRFERYRTQSDFIPQYIFPGGMLASPSRLVAEAERAGLRVVRSLRFGRDYG